MQTEASTARDGGRLDEPELGAWRGFLRAHAQLVRDLDAELLAAHGISLSSYEVLLLLSKAPDRRRRMSELANATLITLGGVTRLVDRLERCALVRRERDAADGRGIHAVLTDEGYEVLRAAAPTHLAGVRRRFLSHLTREQQHELAAIWEAIVPEGSNDRSPGTSCGVE